MNSSARPHPELLPYNARSEVIDTMHRIGHVFIMIGAAPSRSVDVGDVDTSCRLRIVFMRTWPTKPTGRDTAFCVPARARDVSRHWC